MQELRSIASNGTLTTDDTEHSCRKNDNINTLQFTKL